MIDKQTEQYFDINWSKLKQIPPPLKPPLNRIIRDGVWQTCDKCGSSMVKNGFLGLFGERVCINKECYNSDGYYKQFYVDFLKLETKYQ